MERSLTSIAFAGAVLAILGYSARASAADSKDVRVVNTAEEAVPVAVINPTTAPVNVAGRVEVASLPSDQFQKHVGNLVRFADPVELKSVPAGKLLVLEYINAFEGSSGCAGSDYLQITTSDDEGGVFLLFRFVSGYVDTHPRIIVGPGRAVSARNFGCADATLTVSGHYEPTPTWQ